MAILDYGSLSVLVVDDHMVIRKLLEQNLLSMGFCSIDMASSGDEATEKLRQKRYDIVFLDWNMPGKSGYNVLQEFREDRHYDGTAFVMVTAESQERYVIEALKAGATSYIIKPVSATSFKDKVAKVLTWLAGRRAAGYTPEKATGDV